VESIRLINKRLIEASYSNTLIQNSNLTNQIKTRLANLITDSLHLGSEAGKINDEIYDNMIEDFLFSHSLISKKYLNAREFRLGVGGASLFLPKITYYGSDRVDYSQFEFNGGEGSDTLNMVTQYTSEKMNSLFLSADFPYGKIDAIFKGGDASHIRTLPVQMIEIAGEGNDLFHRDTITSNMNVEYDLNFNVSIRQVYNRITECGDSGDCPANSGFSRDLTSGSKRQGDFGIGFGLTAIDFVDVVSRDFRLETDAENSFNNLETAEVVEASKSNSHYLFHYGAYYTVNISDELSSTFTYRRYRNKDEIDIGNTSIELKLTWYPSFLN